MVNAEVPAIFVGIFLTRSSALSNVDLVARMAQETMSDNFSSSHSE
ncbi:hypothetical protein [Morganella psychrotolerans]|nr:hypothetical protein [Morganella psychrotolerans]